LNALYLTHSCLTPACHKEKGADCHPGEQKTKSKVRVMPCAASASPQVEWRGVHMYLLTRDRDRAGAGRGSLQMSVYAVFCRAIPEVQNGLLCRG
jgi:hypothetical protein